MCALVKSHLMNSVEMLHWLLVNPTGMDVVQLMHKEMLGCEACGICLKLQMFTSCIVCAAFMPSP